MMEASTMTMVKRLTRMQKFSGPMMVEMKPKRRMAMMVRFMQ